MSLFIMIKFTEEAEIKTKTQSERMIKVSAKSENNIKDVNPNQIKNSKTLTEDTIKKKAMKNIIEESIKFIRNQNKCSNQLANQAINKFLEQQEKKMEKVILEKIMNLDKTEAALRENMINAQAATEIIHNNREILENKLNSQNTEKNPADIAYSENLYDPAHIGDSNKDQRISINLENVLSKILELQVTQEKITPDQMNKANDKTSGPGKSARDENSEEKTVNLDCTKTPNEDQQITFDLEHVLSRTMES